MSQPEPVQKTTPQIGPSLVLANVAAQVGCVTFGIIIAALLLGLWLDRVFQIRGLFTILLVLASVPLTWVFIFWTVNRAKKQIEGSRPAAPQDKILQSEEEDRDNF